MYHLQVLTAEEVVFDGEVTSIIVPGKKGYLGILTDHAPLISSLQAGHLVITDAKANKHFYKIQSGVVHVDHNQVSVLVDGIHSTPPIDLMGGF